MSNSRSPPSALARSVRQRCGFGCVICGSPIYDYDHIVDYAIVKEHTFDNLALMCPTCHRKKTNGLITGDMVREARKFAETRSRTSSDEFTAPYRTLLLGRNVIDAFSGHFFSIKGFGWMSIRFDQRPLISATLFDENGSKAIEVHDSIYTLCRDTWDIDYVGKTLTFRNQPRRIFARLTFEPKGNLIVLNGNLLLRKGSTLKIGDDGIFLNRILLATENHIEQCHMGVLITNIDYRNATVSVTTANIANNEFIESEIAVLDTSGCRRNLFKKCDKAFVWTESYLEKLSGK